MPEPVVLPIIGKTGQPFPNRFFRQEPATTALAVIFPGMGYNTDMPLLYYTGLMLRMHGADVLQVRADYMAAGFQSLSPEERLGRLAADASTGIAGGLAQGDYQQLILAGKSIGTLSMALALQLVDLPQPPVTIWLTPLFRESLLVEAAAECQAPSLFIAGTGDPTYIPAAMTFIQKRIPARVHLVEKANHSLETPDDPYQSLDNLKETMRVLSNFLDEVMVA